MASVLPPTRAVAFVFDLPIVDTSGKLVSGATISAYQVSKDGAAFATMTNAPAAIGASGFYTISLTATEMTADRVAGKLVVTGNPDVLFEIFTTLHRLDDIPLGIAQTGDSFARLGVPFNASIAADIAEAVANIGGDPAAVWAYATRTLTLAAASVPATLLSGKVTVYAGTTWSITFTNLLDFTGWTKLYFTVKTDRTKADSTALIQILLTSPGDNTNDGLRIVNGATYGTHADGSIVVNSTTSITVTVKPAANSVLSSQGADYDVKAVISAVVNEISDGSGTKFSIINPTTLTYS